MAKPNKQEPKPAITEAELIKKLMAGCIMCVGLYWSGRLEKLMVRDKTSPTGARRVMYIMRQTILTDSDPLTLTEFLPDDFDPETWVPPFEKQQKVVAFVKGIEMKDGVVKMRGELCAVQS